MTPTSLSPPSPFDPTTIRGGDADLGKVFASGVRVGRTPYGLGLFAFAFIPAGTRIAQVLGKVIHNPDYSSDYCIDVGNDSVLEPATPFCYLNHSCEPNCTFLHYVSPEELDEAEDASDARDEEDDDDSGEECFYSEDDWASDESAGEYNEYDEDDEEDEGESGDEYEGAEVWVETLTDVFPGEELTIDYSWPADRAARCLCGATNCRGWIVDPEELDLLLSGEIVPETE